jgi:hypothetical protein
MIERGAVAPKPRARAAEVKPEERKPAAEAPAPRVAPSEAPPQAYLDAVARLQEENPSIRKLLSAMRFVRFDGKQVVVEFSRKEMTIKAVLEKKKPLIEAALAGAFNQPVGIVMNIQGRDQQPRSLSDAARDVINQAYDVFGREKTSIED